MKRIYHYLFAFILLTISLEVAGQSYTSSRGYTMKRSYLDKSIGVGNPRSVSDITYLDGFGRSIQEVQVNGAPGGGGDLILPRAYSHFSSITHEYLPYVKAGNNGAFDPTSFQSSNWSVYGTAEEPYAFSHTEYDNSPMNRPLKQTGAGKAWHTQQKGVSYSYCMNESNEVAFYRVSASGILSRMGYYAAGTLRKEITTDEDGHTMISYTDNTDTEVLSVRIDGSDRLETYKVCDDRGLLRWVLPPHASELLKSATGVISQSAEALIKFSYSYTYDGLKRMVCKRLPGCDPIYMVYDGHDRLILSQDGNQRTASTGKWTYSVYDSQSRVVESGEILLPYPLSHQQLQQAAGESDYYLPSGTRTALQYTVYDNYLPTAKVTAHPFKAFSGYSASYHPHVSGLPTSTRSRVLGTADWITTTRYYDDQCRVIQILTQYPQKSVSYVNTAYDFVGNKLKYHEVIGGKTLETIYSYDDRGRLLTKKYLLNGNVSDHLNYEYDPVGRMTVKNYAGRATESLSYNIRGWLTGIHSPYFTQTLHYTDGTGTPCYNGNISSMSWKSGSDVSVRGYKFSYDGLSRLKNAVYGEGSTLATNINRFSEQVTGYDRMGNILGLKRYGQTSASAYGLVDNLSLSYNGNQLISANDNATSSVYGTGMEFKDGVRQTLEYEYDKNGNLTKDFNKKITSIRYNCLNLPDKLQLDGGNSLSNLYCSDGTKLRTTRFINGKTTTTDYCGSAIYENGVLSKVLTEDGYITAQDNKAHYFIQDHQGNTRVVVDNGGKVEELTHYYPFGGIFSSTNNVQPYKYNGKELDRSGGLDWYDYGARMYDAAIGRWHVVDPMAEKYYSSNPYNYCDNEPVGRIDPDGADWIQDNFGFYLWDNAATSQDLTRSNWTYIGADLPDDVSGYHILEEIGGSLYHKNTINPFASLINSIFGEGTLVEKKRYDPSEEHMMQQAVNTGAEMSLGLVGGKLTGRLVAKVLSSKLTPLGKGITGRNIPNNLSEQLAMEEILSKPQLGKSVIQNIMDSRWKGWDKMQYVHTSQKGENIVIHYVGQFKNGKLIAVDDFKFK